MTAPDQEGSQGCGRWSRDGRVKCGAQGMGEAHPLNPSPPSLRQGLSAFFLFIPAGGLPQGVRVGSASAIIGSRCQGSSQREGPWVGFPAHESASEV